MWTLITIVCYIYFCTFTGKNWLILLGLYKMNLQTTKCLPQTEYNFSCIDMIDLLTVCFSSPLKFSSLNCNGSPAACVASLSFEAVTGLLSMIAVWLMNYVKHETVLIKHQQESLKFDAWWIIVDELLSDFVTLWHWVESFIFLLKQSDFWRRN